VWEQTNWDWREICNLRSANEREIEEYKNKRFIDLEEYKMWNMKFEYHLLIMKERNYLNKLCGTNKETNWSCREIYLEEAQEHIIIYINIKDEVSFHMDEWFLTQRWWVVNEW
jgi:hypothetical protein